MVEDSVLNSLQHFELLSCSIQEIIRWVSELHNDLQSYIVPKELLWEMVDHALLLSCLGGRGLQGVGDCKGGWG